MSGARTNPEDRTGVGADVPARPPSSFHRRPWGAVLAWVVILGGVAYLVWWNHTAAAPPVPPLASASVRSNAVLLAAGALMLLAAVTGLFLFVTWGVLVLTGRLRLWLHASPQYGAVYAETFALWLLLFLGLSYGLRHVPAGEYGVLLSGGAMLAALIVLAWPLLRGVGWQRLCADLGLHPGSDAGVELLCGVGTYAVGLAFAVAGVLVTLAVMALLKQLAPHATPAAPTHPVAERILQRDWRLRLQIVFTAVVAAPIVEETMFRGLLYRHLREASARWGRVASIVLGTLLTSFLFAVIHPQGWLGVPPLMGLATAFTLAREWRGSLLPGMTAHAVNNAVTTVLLILAFG